MGVHVSLVHVTQTGSSGKGRSLRHLESAGRSGDTFAGVCAGSGLPLLSRVDPYRSLILTAADMTQFVSEIETTRARCGDAKTVALLDDVRALALRCAAQPDLEIHLDGD
ncbi:hypothetical protein ABZ341_29215 [Streptomyces sp. NPDC006173]|uniref:hypothetical protein n=1 Tax=unclassified Streptomyces TaxID=2593676 RepID=UPI00340FB94E